MYDEKFVPIVVGEVVLTAAAAAADDDVDVRFRNHHHHSYRFGDVSSFLF